MAARYTGGMRVTVIAELALVAVLATACLENPASPDLVSATGLSPQIVEVGDSVQLSGHGFPEGVPARLSFRGDLFRAGQVPERNVEIVVRSQDVSKDTITLSVNDEIERAFCGAGDAAAHTTFRGNVGIAFAAPASGMAPVSGTLRDVDFEIEPKQKSYQVEQERQRVSNEALRFLGLSLTDNGQSDCCTLVEAQGRALLAGLKPGDRLLDFDGVSVIHPSDLVPSGRNRTARLTVRHEGAKSPMVHSIDVQGFRWTIPSELAPALACLLTALGFLLTAVSPIRSLLKSLSNAIATGLAQRLQEHKPSWNKGRVLSVLRQWSNDSALPESASVKIAGVGGIVGVGSLAALMAIREELLSAELDLLLWWLVTSLAITLIALLLSIVHMRNGPRRGLLFAAQALLHQIPLLTLIASIIVVTHTMRLSDIVHAQGGWPQDWLIVHDPALCASAILVLIALSPAVAPPQNIAVSRSGALRNADSEANSPSAALISFVANRLHLWIQALLFSVLVLGGWAAPGLNPAASNYHTAYRLLGIAGLLAKSCFVVATVSTIRWSLGALSLQHTAGWLLRRGLFVAVAMLGLTIVWGYCVRTWAILWADVVVHWVVLGLLLSAWGLLVQQTLQCLKRGVLSVQVNPWI
jgi:NADH-quinone oxidoreductase subunit H